ncbi:MAG: Mur ligase domain-containing protein, partial [Oscillospiraceae bacterium]
MKLEALLKGIKVSNKYDDVEIKDVSSNSQTVKNDSVFVCIKGRSFDSHIVAPQLENQGVRAFVVEHDVGVKNQIIVENTRKAYAVMCSNLHGIPSQS